jgi:hypothetical protein
VVGYDSGHDEDTASNGCANADAHKLKWAQNAAKAVSAPPFIDGQFERLSAKNPIGHQRHFMPPVA